MATSTTHQSTHITSSAFPALTVRWIAINDGAAFAELVSPPDSSTDPSKVLDEEWGRGAVARMNDHAVRNPTVTDPRGRVTSGPAKANLLVVESDEPIGIAGFGCIKSWQREDRDLRAGDAGVVLKREKRGCGYATEAMKLTLDFGARSVAEGGLQLDLLTITTLEDNDAMMRVIERLGLDRGKAVLRPAEFDKHKQELYFEITAEEWKKERG